MSRSSSSARLCLALAVLLCGAPAADALCYWSPITFVRTCTSWSFPSTSYSSPSPAPAAAAPPSTYSNPGRAWGPMYKNPTPSPYAPTKPPTPSPYYMTEAPTKAPTPSRYYMTEAPTPSPYAPTKAPTEAPTPAPYYPTEAPTKAPTPSPYDMTEAPTKAPTKAPTPSPYYPTEAPTPAPYYPPSTPAAATTSAPHVVVPATPAPTRGCFGSLPFGLENCVCDGAVAGEGAGMAACSAVYTQCATIQQFSVDGEKQLGAVQRACDSLAASSCSMTAKQLAMSHPVCASLLAGEGSCTSDEAMALLDASVKDSCDPLCPDCAIVDGPSAQPTEPPAYPTATTTADESFPTATTTADEEEDEPQQKQVGCFGDLPMGLEQCVCDGATIGEAAGLAACSAVFAECMDLMPFSVDEAAPPTDKSCDSLAQSACVDTGMQLALAHQPCAQLLFQKGFSSKCSPEKAREIFQGQMEGICAPLCPDCPRLPF